MTMTFPKCLGALLCCALGFPAAGVRADDDAAALRTAIAAERARAPETAPLLPRDAFLPPRDAVFSVRLSPDGRHVAYLREQAGQRSLWLLPTAGGIARSLLAHTHADEAYWSRDGHWLFLAGPRALSTLSVDDATGVRIDLGGSERRALMRVDASQAAAVLLREHASTPAGERWRVLRMDVRGQRTLLREDEDWIRDVATDASGHPAALLRFERDHDALYRVDADDLLHRVQRWDRMERGSLLGTTTQGDLLLASDAGGNLRGVLRMDRAGVLHTLHQDPRGEADLDEVVLDPASGQPWVASYRSTVAASYGLGQAQSHVAAITRHFPGRDVGISVAAAPDAQWLIGERDSTLRQPRWHLYDPRSGTFRRILETEARSAEVAESALARKLAFTYRASDGLRVHGFLLLPPGADPAHVPLVAQVHGGPINHFRAGYDSMAQFLANRGYAVFQANFRGSTGHGRDYTFAANGDYGNGRVQQDIVEGVRWLLAQGVGDADRVGIVGHSFGGYSALLGATFQPELFKVAVAGSPPADFAWSMRWLLQAGDQGARSDGSLAAMLRVLSIDPDDVATSARLHAQSPLANIENMQRPLLLLAGGADRTVPIRAVIHYAAQLKLHGKDVSLYVEPDGGHSPTDPLPREAYLFLTEAMLHRHLGGSVPLPPSAALRELLRHDVRLGGDGLRGEDGKTIY